MQMLSLLSLQSCGLDDIDMKAVSTALQILPVGRLRFRCLNGNYVGAPGLGKLLRVLKSRKTSASAVVASPEAYDDQEASEGGSPGGVLGGAMGEGERMSSGWSP